MRPRDLVGIDFRVKAMTAAGEIRRIFRAFDRDDAVEQLLNYCYCESLPVDAATIAVFGPPSVQAAEEGRQAS